MALKAQYPFHCIQYASGVIVASAGPKLYSFSATDGRKLSTWPESKTSISGEAAANDPAEGSDGPPEKKRKISPADTAKGDHDENQAIVTTAWSSIPILITSPTGRHVVAVTAEDKYIRVFDINSEGVLSQLNARPAPRKPCGLTFSLDGNTIICADKGGDVYSIPLLGSEEDFILPSRPKKQFKVTANTSVVHSKRNLESLRQQLRQVERGDVKTKSGPIIKRDVLLGHVSMLTDITVACLPSSTSSSAYWYILTADRDEQVRVSRGSPQTHVVEAYCLGHESFISKLCVPATLQHLLVSGGGDDYLFVWDWRNGQLLHKINIAAEQGKNQTVVRGIWATRLANTSSAAIFVALDGSRELLSFLLSNDGKITAQSSLQASGNILDLACNDENGTIFVSVDSCHEPGSTKAWKNNFDSAAQMLIQGYGVGVRDGKLAFEPTAGQVVDSINAQGTEEVLAGVDESAWAKTQKSLSENVERPPIWVMRQAGRYLPEYHEAKGNRDFFECCRSPEIASTLTLQPIERFEGLIDAAIIFSDILVIPQAMGMTVEMIDKKGPSFPEPLISPDDGQYEKILNKVVDVKKELDYVYKAITVTRFKLKGRVPLIGFCGAPWTLLCYMVEGGGTKLFIQSKKWIYKYPNESKAMLQKIAELCVEYLALQVAAGAQLVQVFDSWAGELSPATFKEFSLPYLRYISHHLPKRLQELKLDPVPMTVFAKGAWYALDELCTSGYNVVGLDWLHDPAEAFKIAGGRVTLQGNADPGILYGDHTAITKTVENMVKGFGGGKKGWIANLGHGITPFVNPDDLRFFFEEIHRLSR
ncbi:hypothetical protein UA08_05296 [Talaromyces atroroseus]|uniref:Uroporphyrinogen decarboxylase n=1 Tax=Talaromyces atroroseus TaxID=1441469 RepID=A0A225AJZ9_TALAT|nr:hypothetical protein UA08_05296 [Talaromyces atroroseus]OKL59703.1 hypothetical protein UA08_05296 [Talaromyces atroroseus]